MTTVSYDYNKLKKNNEKKITSKTVSTSILKQVDTDTKITNTENNVDRNINNSTIINNPTTLVNKTENNIKTTTELQYDDLTQSCNIQPSKVRDILNIVNSTQQSANASINIKQLGSNITLRDSSFTNQLNLKFGKKTVDCIQDYNYSRKPNNNDIVNSIQQTIILQNNLPLSSPLYTKNTLKPTTETLNFYDKQDVLIFCCIFFSFLFILKYLVKVL